MLFDSLGSEIVVGLFVLILNCVIKHLEFFYRGEYLNFCCSFYLQCDQKILERDLGVIWK